jgi:hemoglobin/transferrin/lactoferrin receptor protein
MRPHPLSAAVICCLLACAHAPLARCAGTPAAPASFSSESAAAESAVAAPVADASIAEVSAASASAVQAPGDELDRIVVVATLAARAIVDVPNTVDAIDRETMDAHAVRDLKDLFRYEPGIAVGTAYGRFGVGDIRIRGLGGNRVLIQTDGVPVSDGFSIGSFANANRNTVDLDTLKQVEVLRGPGSALHGSDALGGVVAFRTKDPQDYLGADKTVYAGVRLGYESDWNGGFVNASVAGGGERWSWLLAAGHRQGQAQENQGDNASDGALRTAPNPQRRDGRSVLTKLVYAPDDRQRWRLTLEGNEDLASTDVRSGLGRSALTGATVLSLRGEDRQRRVRFGLEHEFDGLARPWADDLRWHFYRQDSATVQDTDELRRSASGSLQRRQRRFDFEQRVVGAEALLQKEVLIGRSRHALTYGIEAVRTDIRQRRDGVATLFAAGGGAPTQSSAIAPDDFPVRDFPISRSTTFALFAQDDIAFAEGAFRLIPAVRIDRYALRPRLDAIFAADNPGVAVVDLNLTRVSPKLGLVWRFAEDWSLFAGYARGFRAPPYSDANIGFTNLAFGYTALPNPDLKPETSDGLEAGVRYAGAALWSAWSVYDNRYRDFIESLRFVGVNADGLQVFQSQNVADARIRGVEWKGGIDGGALHARWRGWSLRAAAAYARGENRSARQPLEGIDPLRGSLGLAFAREAWGIELAGSFAARQRRAPEPTRYRPRGYGVWDIFAHWRFAPGIRADLGVFNLGDKRYTEWADVPGVSATSFTLDRYTRPGRSFTLSLGVEW